MEIIKKITPFNHTMIFPYKLKSNWLEYNLLFDNFNTVIYLYKP